MWSTWLNALDLGILVGFVLSVALGLTLWVRLRRAGGLELALAHIVANPERRRGFVWTVGVSFGAFVAAGFTEALSQLANVDLVADPLTAVLLLLGGIALLVLIGNTLRPSTLSLAEEWHLAESAARASAREGPLDPPQR
jgi:hypothetical protein